MVVGSLKHFTPKFHFGALFGPNKVLEMHIAPFLDQQSVLEQQTKKCGMVLFLRISVIVYLSGNSPSPDVRFVTASGSINFLASGVNFSILLTFFVFLSLKLLKLG